MMGDVDRGRTWSWNWKRIAAVGLAILAVAAGVLGFRADRERRSRERIELVVRNLEQGEEIARTNTILGLNAAVEGPEEFVRVFPALLGALGDASPMIRGAALSATSGLIERYGRQGQAGAGREAEVEALGRRAESATAARLDDPSPFLRAAAARALQALASARRLQDPPPRLVDGLDDEDEQVRKAAAAAVAAYARGPERIVPVALRRLPTEGRAARSEFARVFHYTRLEPSVLPLLIEGLASPDPEVRRCCATAINHMGPDAGPALPALVAAIREELARARSADPPPLSEAILAMASGAIGENVTDASPAPPGTVEVLGDVLKHAGPPAQPASEREFRLAEAAWSLGILGRSAASAAPLLLATYEAAPRDADLLRGIVAEALVEVARGTPDEDRALATLAGSWAAATPKQRPVLARALRAFGPKAQQLVPELKEFPPDDAPSKIRRVRYPR
ncbi:HEAT repeat domain-containing protein [Paludisphaera soli]|uniref:HEAT repeat domain-containing protein n=1 Tax=Paludisphaera soli TaxID=2712865 RepID=UPI0013ECD4ED|nr:hypothetical protein [Paludisphaera soli]